VGDMPQQIENEEQKIKRQRRQVVNQLESARSELSIVKRFLDAPQRDPYWELWKDEDVAMLADIQQKATDLQLKIRELTTKFYDGVFTHLRGQ
jgi:hypothetical protein